MVSGLALTHNNHQRISNPGNQQVESGNNVVAVPREISNRGAEVLFRDASQLWSEHDVLLALDLEYRGQAFDQLAIHCFSRAERYDYPGCQIRQQVALNIQQQRVAGDRVTVLITVRRKLRHQKLRSPSLKTPCFSTSSL